MQSWKSSESGWEECDPWSPGKFSFNEAGYKHNPDDHDFNYDNGSDRQTKKI